MASWLSVQALPAKLRHALRPETKRPATHAAGEASNNRPIGTKDDDLARDLVEALRSIRRLTEILASNIASSDASETAAQELDEQADRLARPESRMTGKLNAQ
jgi:hypothetical protein